MLAFVSALMAAYMMVFFAVGFCRIVPDLMRRNEDTAAMARRVGQELCNAFCFALTISLVFYLKLLVPLFRSGSYDQIYESIDHACFLWLDPLIAWRGQALQFNWVNHLYFVFFFGMFLVSFLIHGLRDRSEFRRVFLATLMVQACGGVLYFAAPAMGPFLYHPSANAWIFGLQQLMHGLRMDELTGGVHWLQENSGRNLTYGLAAMPSLHAAASCVFLYYGWRHVRWLGIVYTPAFLWILFEAMASRWHYGADLVVGLLMAYACILLSERWMSAHEAAQSTQVLKTEVVAAG